MAKLIVNADDFGLTSGVNRAVAELYLAGVLTSTTAMAQASATQQAIRMARATPALGLGCHVVLVDGMPVLNAELQRSGLMDAQTGRFHPTLGSFLLWLSGLKSQPAAAQARAEAIEAEASAQIALLQASGIQLTHIDTHKHVHIFPAVLRPVLRAARRAGITAVRNPFEPAWSVRATPAAPWLRRFQVHALRSLEASFRRIVAQEGFRTTDGALGVLATGTLDAKTVQALVAALPANGVYELVTHPGYYDADLARAHTRLLDSRELELQALRELGKRPGIELVSFAALG